MEGDGYADIEDGAYTFFAFEGDLSSHEIGIIPYYIQSQTGPLDIDGILCSEKSRKQMLLIVPGNADTEISDFNTNRFIVRLMDLQLDRSVFRRVFDCIGE